MTAILGISAFYHDSAAAIVVDGQIVAAAQEERFTRKKHDHGFPTHAVDFCLQQAGLEPRQLDYVGFYDKPFLKFERLLETYLACAPRGFRSFLQAMPLWLRQKLHLPREISRGLKRQFQKRCIFTQHHESHAASAFFPSPFEEAAILTLDGVGEWATASWGAGRGNRIHLDQEMRFPHSLGLLYSAFTYYAGFTVNSGEYKLMGLAPYGEPKYVDVILEKLIDLKGDGSFRMDMQYFDYCHGLTMTSKRFERLFGGPPRKPDSLLTQRDMDIAASIQKVTEEIMLRAARYVHAKTGLSKLCLAGGVALNCVGNGRILREGPFDDVWIQPAAGDAGGALGAALFIWHQLLDQPRTASPMDSQRGSLLGPVFTDAQIGEFLESVGAQYTRIDDDQELCDAVADAMAEGSVIGFFQGAMEFGPRALGSRSLLGDPRNPDMQTVMNVKVKFREGFRPFAPAVLEERAQEYFDVPPNLQSPYMLIVAPVRDEKRRPMNSEDKQKLGIDKLKVLRSVVPAVTHVDYSARIQTVDCQRHGIYHRLIESFDRKTGCPVIVNTSFNLGWDPIVCTPQEAYNTFMASDVDVLCMGHFVLAKSSQRAAAPPKSANRLEALLGGLWCSPNEQAAVRWDEGRLVCTRSGQSFPINEGIPQLYWPSHGANAPADVSELATAGAENSPFPAYDAQDSVRSLIEQSRRDSYVRALDESIPYNSFVLDVGCGAGRLANLLGVSCRRVVGVDVCLNSLHVGERFRREHGLERVCFVQMNPLKPCFLPEQFDVVICNSALQYVADPRSTFKSLQRLVRPGGHFIVGLSSRFGQIRANRGRSTASQSGSHLLDGAIRRQRMSPENLGAWGHGETHDPQNLKLSIDDVRLWAEQCGFDVVRVIPSLAPQPAASGRANLFDRVERRGLLDQFLAQSRELITGGSDGGFMVVIARSPASLVGGHAGVQPRENGGQAADNVLALSRI